MTASLRDIRVYTTFPHPCSYLKGREATTLFIDPRQNVSAELYTSLSLIGFRRSGSHIYRPHCANCNACLPARVPVRDFSPSRSQRRIAKRNADLRVEESESIFDDQAFSLYQRYIDSRHRDGDMYPADREQYESFLNNGLGCTHYYRFYEGEALKMVMVVDHTLDGLSAIYTFFDPDDARRSLGSFGILYQIELARVLGLDYVYLGYWIQNCDKMNYKSKFTPIELFSAGSWQRRHKLPRGGDLTPETVKIIENS